MSAAVLDGQIYVPGGLGGLRTFEVYDPRSNRWRTLARLPAGRHKLGFRVKELIGGLDWWKRDGHKTEGGNAVTKDCTCGCE
jgi:hypothetical protein